MLMDSFKHRNKDLVFLVDNKFEMQPYLQLMQDALKLIFDSGLEQHDRISLITYSKITRIIFSLVDKDKNFTQLRN